MDCLSLCLSQLMQIFHWPKPEKEMVVIIKQPLRGPTKSLYTVLNLYLFLGLSLLNIRLPYGTEKAESLPCDKSKEGKEEPN